jgi:GGDEF domain-containing protein
MTYVSVFTVKRAMILIVPSLVLAAAFSAVPQMGGLDPVRRELVMAAPYLVAALGMFLAVHFHRGRPFLALFLLAFFYWSCRTFLVAGVTTYAARGVYLAFAFFLPVDFALIAAMRERGILTPAGRMRAAFLACQALFAVWLFRYRLADLDRYVDTQFVTMPVLDRIALPQTALAVSLVSLLVIGLFAFRRGAPVDSSLLGAQAAFIVAGGGVTNPDIPVVFCTAGALIVTFGILQDSYNMAFRDDLTGIPSRRALNENIQGIGRSYAIAMIDVDHFKKFNDTYGHDVGDQVLKMVAAKIRDVGGGGRGYRYGGEEFTVVFPGRRVADALPHLEELRKTIAGYRLHLRGSDRPRDGRTGKDRRGTRGEGATVSVTVSIGVAENGDGHTTSADVIKAADRALYKAKHQGRNLVCR